MQDRHDFLGGKGDSKSKTSGDHDGEVTQAKTGWRQWGKDNIGIEKPPKVRWTAKSNHCYYVFIISLMDRTSPCLP